MKKQKGFTLAETIVSLTLIVLIMLAACSTMLFAEQAIQREREYDFSVGEIENLLRCYQSGNFETAANFVYGVTTGGEGAYTFYFDNGGNIASIDGYTVRIAVSYTANSFIATAYDKEGKLIYEMPEYTK